MNPSNRRSPYPVPALSAAHSGHGASFWLVYLTRLQESVITMWMEPISQEELTYVEQVLHSIPPEPDVAGPFLAIASRLVDYADSQCWYNLADYYALTGSQPPAHPEQLLAYVLTNRAMFLDIIANYRDMEGVG